MGDRIRLGVIGPLWIRETIENCLMMFPSIQSTLRLSDQLTDAITFTEQLRDEVDAILYSGQAPLFPCKIKYPFRYPSLFYTIKRNRFVPGPLQAEIENPLPIDQLRWNCPSLRWKC